MKQHFLSVGVVLSLNHCQQPNTQPTDAAVQLLQQRIDQLEQQTNTDERLVRRLQQRAERVLSDIGRTTNTYHQAEMAFNRAQHNFDLARTTNETAADALNRCRVEYEHASRNYRIISVLVVVAASMDIGTHLCNGVMSTTQYRRQLASQGISLEGKDVDHILAHSLGGANHPLNYQLLESSLNRSLGDDFWTKLYTQPEAVISNMVISALMRLRCANDPQAFGR